MINMIKFALGIVLMGALIYVFSPIMVFVLKAFIKNLFDKKE